MKCIVKILIVLSLGVTTSVFGQVNLKYKGFGVYKKYDKSFITPYLRAKHSFSLGGILGAYGPEMIQFDITQDDAGNEENRFKVRPGIHLGYNYLILEKRALKISKKNKTRNHIKFAAGLHLNFLRDGEFMLMGNVFRPLLRIKGRLVTWHFFSEYGLGVHKTINLIDDPKPIKLNLSAELMRVRFGKSNNAFHLTFNYDTKNDFLSPERLNIGILFGIRLYFFKEKI